MGLNRSGYAVDLDQAPGLNQIGETALHDKVNNHYLRIFGTSLAIGAIGGLSTIGTNNSAVTGLPTSNASAYREGVAASLSQNAGKTLSAVCFVGPFLTGNEDVLHSLRHTLHTGPSQPKMRRQLNSDCRLPI
jgi:type IV secretion system protein VirB10